MPDNWTFRVGQSQDCDALSRFRCSGPNSKIWDIEVERFIQESLCDWVFAAEDAQMILMEDSKGTLTGVAAYQEISIMKSLMPLKATELTLVALGNETQGKTSSDGKRASDLLMSAVLTDINTHIPPRSHHVFATVHKDNVRSLTLCRRHNLTRELSSPSEGYLRFTIP